MSDLFVLLTHVGAAGIGYLVGRLATHAALRKVVTVVDEDAVDTVPEERGSRSWWHPGTWTLVVALVVLLIGTQALVAQREAHRAEEDRINHQRCLTRWSDRFIEAVTQRTTSSGKVTDAEGVREKALDRIIRSVYQAANTPGDAGETEEQEFRNTLAAYVEAANRLERARRENKQVRQEVPYPEPPSELCEEP